jgi:Putative MetA-pathway of phenol degradation
MKPLACLRLVIATMLAMGALCPQPTLAQMARSYWKSLAGGYGIPLVYESMSGNTNPFDPSHNVVPGANFSATLALAGAAHTFSLSNRAASLAVIVPMGRISGEVTAGGRTFIEQANGFGDPMIEFDINILGPRAQKSIPDIIRYEPGFSIDLLADLAVPIGKYDSSKALNIGLNRWYGRVAMPIVWQLGPWVPGRRTTLEFLPSVWFFGNNDDKLGQTLETDPAFQLEADLTRDFTDHFWGSLEALWFVGGKSSINGVSGEGLNNAGFGFTLGYTINDNLGLRFGYKSTVNDRAPEALRMDVFTVSLVFGWHPIIEGLRRLKGE